MLLMYEHFRSCCLQLQALKTSTCLPLRSGSFAIAVELEQQRHESLREGSWGLLINSDIG